MFFLANFCNFDRSDTFPGKYIYVLCRCLFHAFLLPSLFIDKLKKSKFMLITHNYWDTLFHFKLIINKNSFHGDK